VWDGTGECVCGRGGVWDGTGRCVGVVRTRIRRRRRAGRAEDAGGGDGHPAGREPVSGARADARRRRRRATDPSRARATDLRVVRRPVWATTRRVQAARAHAPGRTRCARGRARARAHAAGHDARARAHASARGVYAERSDGARRCTEARRLFTRTTRARSAVPFLLVRKPYLAFEPPTTAVHHCPHTGPGRRPSRAI
jgi:hypothetical protein